MIRPEAKEHLMRWREVLVGAGALLLGLWWLLGKSALLMLPGAAFALGGAALIWIGVQRARFRGEGQGPGSVQVDEGQITYFGPLTGGAAALQDLSGIILDPTFHPMHWRLTQPGMPELVIPVNADGAERLFDAFATLPGLRMDRVLATLKAPGKHPSVIWRRDARPVPKIALH